MRIALISDIHGNLTALDAVLAEIEVNAVDLIICLGDVATIGPQPQEVIQRLINLKCIYIDGNHDAALLDMENIDKYQIAPPLYSSLEWCLEQLQDTDLNFLSSFQSYHEPLIGSNNDLLCFHGSPRSNTDLILADTNATELDSFLIGKRARIMAGGHSHLQMLRQYDKITIINPGSVGAPFENIPLPKAHPKILPWAEYALLDYDTMVKISFRRVKYDLLEFKEVVLTSQIPIKNWWLEQFK